MISSESNPQIKDLIKLQNNARHRKKSGLFVTEGIKLTKEAAGYGRLQRVYLSEHFYVQAQEQIPQEFAALPVEVVSDGVFAKAADTVTPQGVLGVAKMPEYTLEDILTDRRRLYVLLDDLRDPGNLGTIVRTAEGAGASGVILSRQSVDLFNPKVVRSTMGAIFRVPFYYTEDLPETICRMKERGIQVYGTLMEGSLVYDRQDYTGAAGFVIGNEANGLSDAVIEQLSGRIRIPMGGSLESLNAAVSAAIVLYEADRQRRCLQETENKV